MIYTWTLVSHRDALSPSSNHLLDHAAQQWACMLSAFLNVCIAWETGSWWKREMERCEGGRITVCVRKGWGRAFISSFGRLTFHWCDWREMQQQGLDYTLRMRESVQWCHISCICTIFYIYFCKKKSYLRIQVGWYDNLYGNDICAVLQIRFFCINVMKYYDISGHWISQKQTCPLVILSTKGFSMTVSLYIS